MNSYLRLKICMNDIELSKKLRNRFLELSNGIVFTENDDYDLIISDSETLCKKLPNSILINYDYNSNQYLNLNSNQSKNPNLNSTSFLLGSKKILDYIISQYESIYDTYFMKAEEKIKLISFLSPLGGSGLSTISYSFSLRLARKGKSILLIRQYNSSQLYYSRSHGELLPPKKLEYQLSINRKISLRNYTFRCEDGFDILEISDQKILGRLLKEAEKIGEYDFVIFALKGDELNIIGDKNFLILNALDKRSDYYLTSDKYENYIKIKNRGKAEKASDLVVIPNDEGAFHLSKESIEIEGDSKFMLAIDSMVKELESE